MTRWTTPTDVTDRWIGSGAPTDTEQLTQLIEDAETLILAEYPKIQDRIAAETLSVDVVRLVTVRIVTRILRNPEALTYWQQNTGPFGQGRSFGDKDIWLTSDERNLLAPQGRGKAFSVDVAPNLTNPYPSVSEMWEDYR